MNVASTSTGPTSRIAKRPRLRSAPLQCAPGSPQMPRVAKLLNKPGLTGTIWSDTWDTSDTSELVNLVPLVP